MVTRWWAVALLSLSVGLNLGLVVAVVQQRFAQPAPAPTVIVMPSPGTASAAAGESPAPPVAVSEVGPPPVPVASPLRGPSTPSDRHDRQAAAASGADQAQPPDELADALGGGPPQPPAGEDGRGPLEPDRLGADSAGASRPRGDGPPHARLEEMAARLGVPPGDRPRFIALQRTFIAETRQRHVQLEAARRSLRAELLAPNPDPQRLRAYVDDSARLHGALERAFVEHVLAARELLDGEAERRYLQFLSRLGPRAGAPRPPPGRVRPGDPRWQRERPWDRRPGPGRGGLRGPGGRGFLGEPVPAPSPI
ncbi:MAG TPA: periplasmic heavy metal sensor [Thermoanaerobaculia bacterium]|nr:periplasmic heavy metal sensor [Thermoanaerobaculia bacterium]